jgi:hypothetical protein
VDLVVLGDRVALDGAEELARIAGTWRRDGDLEVVRSDSGPELETDRLTRVHATEDGIENFMAFHELGHGVDALMRDAVGFSARQVDLGPVGYINHLKESYADVFATLMMARRFGSTDIAEEVAAARAIGSVMWAPQHSQAIDPSSNIDRMQSNGGAIYYTSAAIDGAVAWVRQVGLPAVQAMPPADLAAQAHAILNQVRFTPAAFEKFAGEIADIRLDGDRLVLGPDVPDGFARRIEAATARLGFAFRRGDLPDIAEFRPSYRIDLAAILAPDLAAGAILLSVERAPRDNFQTAHLLETNGSLTDVRILANGDLIRLDAAGHGVWRSAARPAYLAAAERRGPAVAGASGAAVVQQASAAPIGAAKAAGAGAGAPVPR